MITNKEGGGGEKAPKQMRTEVARAKTFWLLGAGQSGSRLCGCDSEGRMKLFASIAGVQKKEHRKRLGSRVTR